MNLSPHFAFVSMFTVRLQYKQREEDEMQTYRHYFRLKDKKAPLAPPKCPLEMPRLQFPSQSSPSVGKFQDAP